MACPVIRRSYLRLFSALFLLPCWLIAPAASAQARNTPSVPGVVVDEVGGAIAGARVTVTDANGSIVQTTTADVAGAFSLSGLVPGTYSVLVEMNLFSPLTLRVTVPDSGSVSALRAVLKAGGFAETVVVTARRVGTRLSETPQKIEVIDATDIERSVAADLTDVLKKNSGVDVVQYTGALSGVGIRGFRPQISGINKRSLLLIDGRPSGVTNLATLLLDNVERIEVLKGAASSVYGSSAMGGVINVITRQSHGKIGGSVRIGAGSFGATEFAGRAGGSASSRIDFDATVNVFDQRDDIRMGNGVTRPATSYKTPHHVLSTSVRNGGQVDQLRHLLNHQSCEGTAHLDRHRVMTGDGLDAYHDRVCAEVALPPDQTAVMGTAANMNYVAVVTEVDEALAVTAAVTAGVAGNATAAGELATWRENETGMQKVPAYAGTINTMLLVNRPLTPAALARVVVTMTEGKSAALHRLAVPSKRHIDLATGTGTDQFCIAAPSSGARALTSASPHMKLGELVGLATRNATLEALRWQNGLEASYTRGVFHALGRYGVKEATLFEDIAPLLGEADLDLLKKNAKAAFYEPLVGSAAHALATVCDRVRYGTIPEAVAADATVQQAAALAANLAAQVHRWAEFRSTLRPYANGDVKALVLRALALGWSEKWRT